MDSDTPIIIIKPFRYVNCFGLNFSVVRWVGANKSGGCSWSGRAGICQSYFQWQILPTLTYPQKSAHEYCLCTELSTVSTNFHVFCKKLSTGAAAGSGEKLQGIFTKWTCTLVRMIIYSYMNGEKVHDALHFDRQALTAAESLPIMRQGRWRCGGAESDMGTGRQRQDHAGV